MKNASKNTETAKHIEVDFDSSDPNSLEIHAETINVTVLVAGVTVMVPVPHILAASLPVGDASLLPPAQQHSAVSDEAGVIREKALDLSKHIERSWVLFGSKEDALNRLYELAAECVEADWDGYGAEAVSQIAVVRSAHFIRRLPEDLPLPEISVEPDGEIALDWSPTPTQTFSVSIGPADRMACAWVNGTEHGHVVVSSNNGEIPSRILQEIQRITNNDSTFRTA